MPDKKISELTHNASITLSDNIPTESAGATRRQTNADLANLYDTSYFKAHVTDSTVTSAFGTVHGRFRVFQGGILIQGDDQVVVCKDGTGFFRQIVAGNTDTHQGTGQFWSVLGGVNNTISGDYSVIVAGTNNTLIGYGATIGGGTGNRVFGRFGGVSAGEFNTVYADYGYIGGGSLNKVGGTNAAVLGGRLNNASGANASVAGGFLNVANGASAFVGGGATNIAIGTAAAAVAGSSNRVEGAYSVIVGGNLNRLIGDYGILGAGLNNTITGNYSSVLGGYTNRANSDLSTVVGGEFNNAVGYSSFVGAGRLNSASANWTVIVGGESNSGTVQLGTIVGGSHNRVGALGGFVGGGLSNLVLGSYGAIGGGQSNTISSATHGVIGGGKFNWVGGGTSELYSTIGGGFTNTAAKTAAVVAGGYQNTAWGDYTSVLGGYQNIATGTYSSVIGGRECAASGDYNLAFGYKARVDVNYAGAVVFGDSRNTPKYAKGTDTLTLHYQNGVYISGGTLTLQTIQGSPGWQASTQQWVGAGTPGTLVPSGHRVYVATGINPANTSQCLWGVLSANPAVNGTNTEGGGGGVFSTATLFYSGWVNTGDFIFNDTTVSREWQYIPTNQLTLSSAGSYLVTTVLQVGNEAFLADDNLPDNPRCSGEAYLAQGSLANGVDGGALSATGRWDFAYATTTSLTLQTLVTVTSTPITVKVRTRIHDNADTSDLTRIISKGCSFSYIKVV